MLLIVLDRTIQALAVQVKGGAGYCCPARSHFGRESTTLLGADASSKDVFPKGKKGVLLSGPLYVSN